MKNCCKCNQIKEFKFFHKKNQNKDGFNNFCKDCAKNWYFENKEKISTLNKIKYIENSEVFKDRTFKYDQLNIEKRKERKRIYVNKQYSNNLLFKTKLRIRNLLRVSIILNKEFTKKSKTTDILNCDFEFFKNYIEAQFTKGMTWNNIHLDHIKPMSTANTEQEVLELNHYTNFQPLFIDDNLKKGTSLIEKQLRLI